MTEFKIYKRINHDRIYFNKIPIYIFNAYSVYEFETVMSILEDIIGGRLKEEYLNKLEDVVY